MNARVLSLLAVVIVASWPAHARQAPAAAPMPPALVDAYLAAPTAAAREQLIAESPVIATDDFRIAVQRLGLQKNTAGDRLAAVHAYETAVALARRAGTERGEASALIGLSSVHGQSGNYVEATQALLRAVTLADASGNREMIASAANNLCNVYRRLGEPDRALTQCERAFALHDADGRAESAARTLNNIGLIHQQQGNTRAALDYYLRSLALKEKFAPPEELITTLANIGSVYALQNNSTLALAHYGRALALAERSGNVRLIVSSRNNIGHAHLGESRMDEAEAAFLAGLALAEKSGSGLTAIVLSNLGIVAIERRQWAVARERLERSRALLAASGDPIGEGEALAELARLDIEEKRPDDAAAKLARARELLAATGTPVALAGVHYQEGLLRAQRGLATEAIASFEKAIALGERARELVAGGTEDRLRFFEERVSPYYGLADVHASAGRAGDAFAAVERARARGLLDVLAAGRPGAALLTPDEQARQREIDATLVSLAARIETERARPSVGPSPIAALQAELARAQRTRDEFSLGLDQSHPEFRFVRGEAPIATPDDLVAALPPRTAVVEFSTGPARSWAFLISRGQDGPALTVTPLSATAQQIDDIARDFTRKVAGRDLGFVPVARRLYDTLLGPLDARLAGIDHLVVVPHGSLWEVPFQALQTPRRRFLVEERALSYAPSASALRQLYLRRRPVPAAPRVVAFGDPHASLPNTAREARAVAALYGKSAAAAVAEAATEQRFRDLAPSADIVHVATHGLIDNASPLYSHVVLAGTRTSGAEGDGRLEGHEILNLRLRADLVVLSACETARGHIAGGEGVLGLSWAIFAAGASTAAVSLWQVDSASTTDLMTAFHRGRRQRHLAPAPTAQAMRAAQRALLAQPEYRHPYYWAGFVIVGVP